MLFVLSGSNSEQFRLLCADGTQAPLSHYRNCNLGRGPGGGMVIRFNFRKVARKFLVTVQVHLFVQSFCFPYFAHRDYTLCFRMSIDVLLPQYKILESLSNVV